MAPFNNDPFRYNMHGKDLKSSHKINSLRFFLDEFNVHPKDRKKKAGKKIEIAAATIQKLYFEPSHCLIIFISGEIMIKAMKEPMKDFESLPWKEILKKYDKYSLRSWLAASEGA